MRIVLAAVLLFAAGIGHAETEYAKVLTGKWEGDIQMARGRTSPDRTLIIESVGEGEAPLAVKGTFGITGQQPGPIQGTLETSGGQPLLRFKTATGSDVVLRLQGEKDLTGTIRPTGTGQRLQDLPIRLKKVE